MWAVVDVERSLRVRQNIGNFLTGWEIICFSRKTQLHWVSFLPQPFPNSSSVRFFIFYNFPSSRITQKYNHMTHNTAWPHIHVSHVATQTDAQDSSTVAVLHRKIARPKKVDVLVSIWNSAERQTMLIYSLSNVTHCFWECYQASPACPSDKSSTTLKISLQVGGMILSRQNRSTGRHTSPSVTLPTTKDRNGGSATSGQWATARLQDKYKKSLKSKSYIIQSTDHDHHTPNGHCWIEKQPLFSVKVIGNALLAGWKISKYWRVWCA